MARGRPSWPGDEHGLLGRLLQELRLVDRLGDEAAGGPGPLGLAALAAVDLGQAFEGDGRQLGVPVVGREDDLADLVAERTGPVGLLLAGLDPDPALFAEALDRRLDLGRDAPGEAGEFGPEVLHRPLEDDLVRAVARVVGQAGGDIGAGGRLVGDVVEARLHLADGLQQFNPHLRGLSQGNWKRATMRVASGREIPCASRAAPGFTLWHLTRTGHTAGLEPALPAIAGRPQTGAPKRPGPLDDV